MNYSQKLLEEQEANRLENALDSFFCDYQLGRLLNGDNIRKMRGARRLRFLLRFFACPSRGRTSIAALWSDMNWGSARMRPLN